MTQIMIQQGFSFSYFSFIGIHKKKPWKINVLLVSVFRVFFWLDFITSQQTCMIYSFTAHLSYQTKTNKQTNIYTALKEDNPKMNNVACSRLS